MTEVDGSGQGRAVYVAASVSVIGRPHSLSACADRNLRRLLYLRNAASPVGSQGSTSSRKPCGMHLGIFSYNVEYGARPDELARACEERGFESFWVGEHTHIPASRQTPYPGGDPLPRPYYYMADPFVSLMAAAAATSRIKVGTAVCLVVEHDPIVLAKTVATLDMLSGGRLLFGIGGGWNAEEMEHHG